MAGGVTGRSHLQATSAVEKRVGVGQREHPAGGLQHRGRAARRGGAEKIGELKRAKARVSGDAEVISTPDAPGERAAGETACRLIRGSQDLLSRGPSAASRGLPRHEPSGPHLMPAAEPREKVEGAQVEPRPTARPTVQVIEVD